MIIIQVPPPIRSVLEIIIAQLTFSPTQSIRYLEVIF